MAVLRMPPPDCLGGVPRRLLQALPDVAFHIRQVPPKSSTPSLSISPGWHRAGSSVASAGVERVFPKGGKRPTGPQAAPAAVVANRPILKSSNGTSFRPVAISSAITSPTPGPS